MGKKTKKSFLIIGVLFAAGILFYTLFSPGIALRAARSAGSSALGLKTDIEDIRFSLLRGSADINEISISNLEGFDAESIMTAESIKVLFEPLSFFTGSIKINEIKVSGVDIFIQQKENSNNIIQFSSRLSSGVGRENAHSRKSVSAELVEIEGIVIHVDAEGRKSTLRMEPVILENISTSSGAGGIAARVFGAAAAGALKQSAGAAVEKIISSGAGADLKEAFKKALEIPPGEE